MKKNQRLKQREIQKIIKKKHCVKNLLFFCYFDSCVSDGFKVAICPSKKISTHVLKNKIKRQIKEMLKDFIDRKLKIVLIVKNNYLDFSYQEASVFVTDIFQKIDEYQKIQNKKQRSYKINI